MSECKLADLREFRGRYHFTWTDGDDWQEKLMAVKRLFAQHERNWNSETKEWDVLASGKNEERLCKLFSNGRRAFLVLRSQTSFLDVVNKESEDDSPD